MDCVKVTAQGVLGGSRTSQAKTCGTLVVPLHALLRAETDCRACASSCRAVKAEIAGEPLPFIDHAKLPQAFQAALGRKAAVPQATAAGSIIASGRMTG